MTELGAELAYLSFLDQGVSFREHRDSSTVHMLVGQPMS
jgi:hypothetical protein